jgi:diguanylate cyclase (GGDEF)-like protein
MFVLLDSFFTFTPEYPITVLDKGWTVTYHNEQFINTRLEDLSDQVGATFNRGDTITLINAYPISTPDVPFPYLMFKTHYCAFEVFLDNTLIASKYLESLTDGTFVGKGFNEVPLPYKVSGKRLTIKLYVAENGTQADLLSPIIGNYDDLYRYQLNSVNFPLFIGIFMIIFGLVFLLISLLFYLRSSGVATQVICSVLNMLIGVWLITAYSCAGYIMNNAFCTLLEYISIFLIIPFVYLLLYDLHKRYNNQVITLLGYACLVFVAIFIILHSFNFVHIEHFKLPYFGLSTMCIFIVINYALADIRHKIKNDSTKIIMFGLCVLCAMFIIYSTTSIFTNNVDYRQHELLSLVPAGALFFALMQLLNYFIFMTNSFAKKREYASLQQIAYADNLTGLPNRVCCDKKLLELNDTTSEFCILSFDLNGLKEVNDNSGHPAGDRLLKSFAEVLSSTFSELGLCCRIGGDEFLVLMDSVDKRILDQKIQYMVGKLSDLDFEDPEINHSVSYGYAFRSETVEKDTHSVFLLADQRMYDFKKKHYAHMMTRDDFK